MNNRDIILEAINGGLDFYTHVLGRLIQSNENQMQLVRNPFYNDKKPSLSIYRSKGRWLFKDFGDPDYQGDVFTFAALHYQLDVKKDFVTILKKIVEDLGLDVELLKTGRPGFDDLVYNGYHLVPDGTDGGFKKAEEYFKQYGIDEQTLREYYVRSLQSYIFKTNDDTKTVDALQGHYIISYTTPEFTKIYIPKPKRFHSLGKKPEGYVFGYREILNRNTRYCSQKTYEKLRSWLIVTGGEKDVLTLAALGYDAVCLNSESSTHIPEHLTNLFASYDKVIVLYDNDETGVKSAAKLCQKYDLYLATLPEELKAKLGKDVSDYIKLGFDREQLHQILQDSRKTNNSATEHKAGTFPRSIYSGLPDFLKIVCSQFDDSRSRDLVLLSSITALSTCFPKVIGSYFNDRVGMNLYCFIAAPASSGKGVAKYGKKLVDGIQQQLINRYKEELYLYNQQLADKESDDGGASSKPEEPVQKLMLIPADTSSTKMVEMLSDNENFGLIFETEADTLSGVLKSDWGDFTATLRKAFHHEHIGLARKGGRGYYFVDKPHLSVFLTGTPQQIANLIPTVENGFFSRFLYYCFNERSEWRNPFANAEVDLDSIFAVYSEQVKYWWDAQLQNENECKVSVTQSQEKRFNDYFRDKIEQYSLCHGDELMANVRRMGLCQYRLCMLFSVLRYFEQSENLPENIQVSDTDFDLAINIIDTLLLHLVTVYQQLTKGIMVNNLNAQQETLYENLPDEFSRNEYNTIAKDMGMPDSTSDKYLGVLVKKKVLKRIKHGYFEKAA